LVFGFREFQQVLVAFLAIEDRNPPCPVFRRPGAYKPALVRELERRFVRASRLSFTKEPRNLPEGFAIRSLITSGAVLWSPPLVRLAEPAFEIRRINDNPLENASSGAKIIISINGGTKAEQPFFERRSTDRGDSL